MQKSNEIETANKARLDARLVVTEVQQKIAATLGKNRETREQIKALDYRAERLAVDLRALPSSEELGQRMAQLKARADGANAAHVLFELQVDMRYQDAVAKHAQEQNQQLSAELAKVHSQLQALRDQELVLSTEFKELDWQLADCQINHLHCHERLEQVERDMF